MKYQVGFLAIIFFVNSSATEWAYLKSEPFKLRYVLAAHYLRSCSEVIEIGGYKTPISDFLDNHKITVIDPLVQPRLDNLILHYAGTLDSWVVDSKYYRPANNNYGVLILGFHLENMSANAWEYLYCLVQNAVITIIEFPIDWLASQKQFEQLLAHTNKKVHMQVTLDLAGNDFGDLTNSWPPRTSRSLYFLQ